MGGKASLIVVVGFGLVLLFYSLNNSSVGKMAGDNFVDHYVNECAYRIAVSGANIAANRFFVSPAWEPSNEGLDYTSLWDGTLRITKYDTSSHKGRITIVSEGTYFGTTRRVTIVMQATSFGKFVLFINDMGTNGYFPGETVFDGPVHVNVPLRWNGTPDPNRRFRLGGTPTFKGKVTSDLMWQGVLNPTRPDFQQGFEDEVHVTLPDEFSESLEDAVYNGSYDAYGNKEIGFAFTNDRNVSVILNPDGTITYKEFKLNDGSFNNKNHRITPPKNPQAAEAVGWVTKSFNELVPPGSTFNGAMLVPNGNLRIRGTLNGNITIGVLDKYMREAPSLTTSSRTFTVDPQRYYGNVWFEDDVLYADDPYTNPNSDDMLGVVATNYLFAADVDANKGNSLITCGSYFSKFKGAITENLWNLPDMRVNRDLVDWEYRGGWTEGEAQYTTSGSTRGYDQKYKYDSRLMKSSPPFFPATGALSILSWYEE